MTITDMRFAHLLSFCIEHPWAITRPMLQTIAGILGRRVAGRDATAADLDLVAASRRAVRPVPDGSEVAVLPIHGIIVPRANLFSDISGGTSADAIAAQLREAVANPKIGAVVLDIDSPGGNVAGITELAADVRRARATKPVHAVASFTMASAAYWIAAQATKVIASPSASVGSIGVLAIHKDLSAALEQEGVKVSVIAAGKYKAEDNPAAPLTDDARAFIQKRVDEAYVAFVRDVSLGRGASQSDVRNGYGEGRAVSAQEALALGMVDEIATLDDVLGRLAPARVTSTQPSTAAIEAPEASEARVASQEPAADVAWLNAIERTLLDLDLERATP
jgi:signal peptide peptidase SppA